MGVFPPPLPRGARCRIFYSVSIRWPRGRWSTRRYRAASRRRPAYLAPRPPRPLGGLPARGCSSGTQRARPTASSTILCPSECFEPSAPKALKGLKPSLLRSIGIEVVSVGEFGNGGARRTALGSRCAEVQAEVNRILGGGRLLPKRHPETSRKGTDRARSPGVSNSAGRPAGSWGPPVGRAIENSFAPPAHRRCADPSHLENR